MAVTRKQEANAVVVTVEGRMMGGDETKEMVDAIRTALDEGSTNIVLELSGVPWMNSTGLGALMESRKIIKDKNGALKLVRINEKIKSLLVMTQTLSHYETFDSVDAAMQTCA